MKLVKLKEKKMSVAFKEDMAMDLDSKRDLIKRTICKGSSDEELELFLYTCKRTGLDPLMKQAYAVKRWSSADKREVMTIQTSIDGYRLIADRTGRYAPGKEPTFEFNDDNLPICATAYIKKMTPDGTWHEVSAVAFYDEYVQKFKDKETQQDKPTKFWQNMPKLMLAKCAESLALRKAFPAELSGIYTHEEMQNSINEEKPKMEEIAEVPFDVGYFADELEKRTGETISHLALESFTANLALNNKSTPAKIMEQALSKPDRTQRFIDTYLKTLDGTIPI